MNGVSIKVVGLKEVQQALGRLAKDAPMIFKKENQKIAEEARAILKVYPPVLAKAQSRSKRSGRFTSIRGYRRTGRLGRSWRIAPYGRYGVRLSNDATFKGRAYAVYVHGNERGQRQAWMHVGRWKVMRPVVDSMILVGKTRLWAEVQKRVAQLGLR